MQRKVERLFVYISRDFSSIHQKFSFNKSLIIISAKIMKFLVKTREIIFELIFEDYFSLNRGISH